MPNAVETDMSDSPERVLLFECQRQIELAWNERMDDSVVHRLAAEHPELADELYDFFADVIEAEDFLDQPRPENAVDRRVRDMLIQARHDNRDDQAAPSKTFLALVRDCSDDHVDDIAESMQMPADFLVDASDHGTKLPARAREEFVRRLRRVRLTREIDIGEALASFDAPAKLRRAASRKGPYRPIEVSYRDLVERSSMSDEEKRYWLDLT
jgi:hypothetical protein